MPHAKGMLKTYLELLRYSMTNIKYKILTDGFKVCEEESVYAARCEGAVARKRTRPKVIDLFTGAGGLTLGFTKFCGHNFEIVWSEARKG